MGSYGIGVVWCFRSGGGGGRASPRPSHIQKHSGGRGQGFRGDGRAGSRVSGGAAVSRGGRCRERGRRPSRRRATRPRATAAPPAGWWGHPPGVRGESLGGVGGGGLSADGRVFNRLGPHFMTPADSAPQTRWGDRRWGKESPVDKNPEMCRAWLLPRVQDWGHPARNIKEIQTVIEEPNPSSPSAPNPQEWGREPPPESGRGPWGGAPG